MSNLNLCWFRTDLRLRDNRALHAAISKGPVAGLYVATPDQWQSHDDAPIKQDFWRRNLVELKAALAERGIPLICCEVSDYAAIPSLMEELIEKWAISSLNFNKEYPLNEIRRDEAVRFLCEAEGVEVDVFDDSVLIPPGSLFNNSGTPFKVFTPFSKKARQIIGPSQIDPVSCPENAFGPDKLPALSHEKPLDKIAWPIPQDHWTKLWPAGEAYGLNLLEAFAREKIGQYREQRDFPSISGTSTLSPWLAAGVVSIRDCWQQASRWQEGDGVLIWQNELLWRDFYKHIMFHYPHVSMNQPFKQDLGHIPWREDETAFQAWCQGRTGIPIIDAGMRQLQTTGWMHNRVRMITAMFLSKQLLIDWRKGESWFMRHLVDGDFSANNGGWQWSASTGTDAVPYFRVFNPVTQSQRFDVNGDYLRKYVPELSGLDSRAIHAPGLLKPECYPMPLVDLKHARERAIAAFKK